MKHVVGYTLVLIAVVLVMLAQVLYDFVVKPRIASWFENRRLRRIERENEQALAAYYERYPEVKEFEELKRRWLQDVSKGMVNWWETFMKKAVDADRANKKVEPPS